jgi:hypothetical protein
MTYKPLTDEELENASGHERLLEQCRRANRLAEAVEHLLFHLPSHGKPLDGEASASDALAAYLGADHDR